MGISTFPATTTGVSGTAVLRLSVPSIIGSGIDYHVDNTMASYDPVTPLPTGTYAVTLTSSSQCQIALLKSNGTVVNAGRNITAASTSSTTVINVGPGETVTKIIFRRPSRNGWPTTFNVEITAITDPKTYYGYSTKQYNNAAALPAGWVTNKSTYGQPMTPGSWKITSTSTKSYFLAYNPDIVTNAYATNNLNTVLNTGVRLYELDISTMALTQKASPPLQGITVAAGFTFPTSTAQSLEHFSLGLTYFIVGTDVAYFVPGVAKAQYTQSPTVYYAMRSFRKMGVYTFSTNVWSEVDGPQYAYTGYHLQDYVPEVCGNDLYIGPLGQYMTGNWITTGTDAWGGTSTGWIGFTRLASHGAYIYSTGTWVGKTAATDGDINNGFTNGSAVKIATPYVKCNTQYQYSYSGNNQTISHIYNPVTNTNRSVTWSRAGMAPDSNESDQTLNFTTSSGSPSTEHVYWCPHPTDPKLVYISARNSGWIYLMNTEIYAQHGIFGLTSITNGCMTRTRYPNNNRPFVVTHDGKFYQIITSLASGQTGSIAYLAEIQPVPSELDTGY